MTRIPLSDNGRRFQEIFHNYAEEMIPRYAVMKIKDTAGDRKRLKAFKPDGDTTDGTLALNLNSPVKAGKSGNLTTSYSAWALYDNADGTPAPGETWGPDDDWLLHKGKAGFVIVGGQESFTANSNTYYRVRVEKAGGSTLAWGKVTTAITAATGPATANRGTGEVQFWDEAGVDVGSPVEIENPYPATFAENSVVCCDRSKSPPRLVSGSCEVFE